MISKKKKTMLNIWHGGCNFALFSGARSLGQVLYGWLARDVGRSHLNVADESEMLFAGSRLEFAKGLGGFVLWCLVRRKRHQTWRNMWPAALKLINLVGT